MEKRRTRMSGGGGRRTSQGEAPARHVAGGVQEQAGVGCWEVNRCDVRVVQVDGVAQAHEADVVRVARLPVVRRELGVLRGPRLPLNVQLLTGHRQLSVTCSTIDHIQLPINSRSYKLNSRSYKLSSTPDHTSSTPDRTSSTPDHTSSTPDRTSSTPDRTNSTPDRTSSTPDRTSSTPDRTSSTPDHTSSTPNHISSAQPPIVQAQLPIVQAQLPII